MFELMTATSRPLAYSYIRMSTDLQLMGDSLRRQAELSRNYAEINNLELVEDYELTDIGVSAFRGANVVEGKLGKFIESVENREIPKGSYLLVESLDRITRQNVHAAMLLFQRITNSGINLVTLGDGQTYRANETDFIQMITSLLIMARSFEESETKSRRLSAAWENKRKNIGDRVLTSKCPAWLRMSDDRTNFVSDRSRAKIVKNIFTSAANGQGSHLITRRLNQTKVPPFGKSSMWVESYVTKILKNRAVLGEFQPHRKIDGKRIPEGDVIEGYYPSVVDEKLFLKVQSDRRKRNIGGGGRVGSKQSNLFTHLAKCAYCGSSMRFLDKGNTSKGGKYLTCVKAVGGGGCCSTGWRYSDFESSFFQFVSEIDLAAILEGSKRRSSAVALGEDIQIEQERINENVKKRKRTYDLLLETDSSTSFLNKRLDELSNAITNSEEKVEALKLAIDQIGKPDDDNSNSQSEYFELISSANIGKSFEKRVLVASKLRDLVKEIEIAACGREPKIEQTVERMKLQNDIPEEDQRKLAAAMKDGPADSPYLAPYFEVHFFDGTHILVTPSKDNPTQFFQKIKVDEEKFNYHAQTGEDAIIEVDPMDYAAFQARIDKLGD